MNLSGLFCDPNLAAILTGLDRVEAEDLIARNHYTHSLPSGKSHFVRFRTALVVWSIPANNNIANFLLGWPGNVWELSRLWAPDGHEKNLLTMAISRAVEVISVLEEPDVLVSYADPNVGHTGGIYRAASWIYHGESEESRAYQNSCGQVIARRAFHSGDKSLRKNEILAAGYSELNRRGKLRFVKPMNRRAAKALDAMRAARAGAVRGR